MRTLVYPILHAGDTVRLLQGQLVRALVPQLALMDQMYGPLDFRVIEIGPRKTIIRHDTNCSDIFEGNPKKCRRCDGLSVTFDTEIWIACEVEVPSYRINRDKEHVPIREMRFVSSLLKHGRLDSYISSEMLEIEPIESAIE